MPIPMTLIALLFALILLPKHPKLGKGLILFAVLLLGATSWAPVADRLIAPLENQYTTFNTSQPVDIVIVLGSGHDEHPNMPAVMQLSRSAIFRLEEGLRILRANPNARLFVSGYNGGGGRPHAELLKEAAIELGVTPSQITTFPLAKDTEEEARMMAPYLVNKKAALVTEASHLRRALGFFDHIEAEVFPAPAFKLGAVDSSLRLSASDAYKSQRAFYEWIGLAWQWLKAKVH